MQSIDRYWNSAIANRYASTITSDLIISGREDARKGLVEFLQSPSGALSLVGETVEEAVAFAAAVCMQSLAAERRSRLLVLSEPAATEHLATLSQDHIVILTDSELYPTILSDAINHLHFVLPEQYNARMRTATDSIDLGTLKRKSIATSLHEMGLEKEEADRIAGESKGSLQALLWMIAKPERGALEWASAAAAAELAPLVLAGQWMAKDHPDHEVVAELAQRDYKEIRQTLAEWSGPGKPLDRRGEIWDWRAWEFAWTRLAPTLQRDDIDRFLKITKEVLGATDPALELAPKDRWLANIRGKVYQNSDSIRKGLAQSLVLLAIHGNLLADTAGQAVVDSFVESLLQVPEPANRWISVSEWLPDLAEAAPDVFIDSLDKLTANSVAVRALFAEGGMFGSSPHTYVLWALERLAWSPDHFARVVLVLARLTTVDPGGNLTNRPERSLRMILLPWKPATGASVGDRMTALRQLFRHDESTAWRCASSLLPQPHDVGDPFARPVWRAWAKDVDEQVTLLDFWSFQEQLVALLPDHAGTVGRRWIAILEVAPALCKQHPELGKKVVDSLRRVQIEEFEREDAFELGDAARALVLRHENLRDSDWTMKGDIMEAFKQINERLRPRIRRDADRWLFTLFPDVFREFDISTAERSDRLRKLRAKSVADVLSEAGFEAVLTWSKEVESPGSLGASLAEQRLAPEQEQQLIQAGLNVVGTPYKRPPLAQLVQGYVSRKSQSEDKSWREQTLASVREILGASAVSFFLQALSYGEETWALVECEADKVRSSYWSEIGLHVLELNECKIAAPELLAASRPFKVIDLIAMLVHGLDQKGLSDGERERVVALARTVLDAKTDHLPDDEYGIAGSVSYEINVLLHFLESHGVSRKELAQWEWYWLPLISHGSRRLESLQAELSEDPELFVDLLKCVYRASKLVESDQEPSAQDRHRAELAFELLETWNRTPGLKVEAQQQDARSLDDGLGPITPAWTGYVDGIALAEWVRRAQELAASADRIQMCHYDIGRQFAYAPAGSDGIWPCIEVRRLIEHMCLDDLEQGMICGVFGRRGVHFVGCDGAQETAIAMRFREWCERVRIEYPRTATILRRLAENYEGDAHGEIERGHFEEFND